MNRIKKIKEALIYILMGSAIYFIVFIISFIIFDILRNSVPYLTWEFFTSYPRRSGAEGGILPAIVGTLYLIAGSIIVALPLGVLSAIYLAEYAKQGRFTRIIRLAIITLAGVPSIVFGLFGLGLFVIFLGFGTSILSGSLTLACMILPTIIVSSEEALRAVPAALRESSLALGATKFQTITKNVLPYSLPGVLTGMILSVGRAAGETAPILFTVAAFYLPVLPSSIFDQVMVLPYHLYVLTTQLPNAEEIKPMQYGTAFVLIAIVLSVNLGAVLIRSYIRRKYKWH